MPSPQDKAQDVRGGGAAAMENAVGGASAGGTYGGAAGAGSALSSAGKGGATIANMAGSDAGGMATAGGVGGMATRGGAGGTATSGGAGGMATSGGAGGMATRGGAGGMATGGGAGGNTNGGGTGSSIAYTTSFGVNESPLSEGGKWKHNNSWFTKVVANGGNVYGTSPNPANAGKYEDSYAFLGGMGFPPNQYVSAHIYKNGTTGGYLEVELQLRVSDTANSTRGYECFLHQGGAYLSVARWSGASMSAPASISYFDVLGTVNNVTAPKDGDLFEAQIVGNIITVKLAGATLYTLDVSKFDGVVIASGDPGIGFDAGGSGAETADSSYGFKDFSAKGL